MALESQINAAARGGTKPPVVGDVFARLLDTIIDASPAQWATFTVDVITLARRQDIPRTELLQLLEMLGITDGKAARRGADGKTVPAKGICPACQTRQQLQETGRVRSHKRKGKHCPGRYEYPADDRQAVAS